MINGCLGSIARATLLAALVASPLHALAQEVYPSRPIEMIVPWGPGGGSDQTGRKIAKLLENELKVSLPVVNVPGATGNASVMVPVVTSSPAVSGGASD